LSVSLQRLRAASGTSAPEHDHTDAAPEYATGMMPILIPSGDQTGAVRAQQQRALARPRLFAFMRLRTAQVLRTGMPGDANGQIRRIPQLPQMAAVAAAPAGGIVITGYCGACRRSGLGHVEENRYLQSLTGFGVHAGQRFLAARIVAAIRGEPTGLPVTPWVMHPLVFCWMQHVLPLSDRFDFSRAASVK
jgi:hypothetical protein